MHGFCSNPSVIPDFPDSAPLCDKSGEGCTALPPVLWQFLRTGVICALLTSPSIFVRVTTRAPLGTLARLVGYVVIALRMITLSWHCIQISKIHRTTMVCSPNLQPKPNIDSDSYHQEMSLAVEAIPGRLPRPGGSEIEYCGGGASDLGCYLIGQLMPPLSGKPTTLGGYTVISNTSSLRTQPALTGVACHKATGFAVALPYRSVSIRVFGRVISRALWCSYFRHPKWVASVALRG